MPNAHLDFSSLLRQASPFRANFPITHYYKGTRRFAKNGSKKRLSIIYNPQNTTDTKDVTWISSNPSVISVENGKLTANAVGTADITAKVGDKTVTCTITVKEEKKAEQPKPVITNKKSDNKPAAKSVSKANDAKKAKTGDNNNVVLFLVMFAAAVAMIGVITGKSLRRNRR